MLPEGWTRTTLGNIAQISSGGTPDRKKGAYWNGDIAWVTTGEIRFNTIMDTAEKITAEGLRNSSAKLFPAGTLLMAMYGQGKTRGQVAKLGIEAATNQNSAAILLHKDQDPDFYFHYLASKYEDIREFGNSGGVSHLNAGLLKQIEVPCAPYAEQRKIGEMLTLWEEAINTIKKLVANSRKQKDVLTSLLVTGKRRLRTDKDWQRRSLKELIVESRLLGAKGDLAKKITVKLYGKGVLGKAERRAGSEATQYYRRRAGQFIYSKLDFLNGAFGIIPAQLDGFESTLDLPAFDFLAGVDPRWFLYYVSREDFYQGQVGLANGGRKARRVNPSDLLQVAIDVPDLPEQQAIADVIDVAAQEEQKWAEMLAALIAQKNGLMAVLLSGKRRVRLPATEEALSA